MVCFGTTIETLLNRRCLIYHCGAGRASAAVSERTLHAAGSRFLEFDSRRKPSEIPILRHPGGLLSNGSTARSNILTLRPYTSRQASYDLRRLRRKGLIDKVPRKRQYHLTPLGRKVAVLFIKAYGRVLAPGLTALDLKLPQEVAQRCPLATAWRRFDRSLNVFVEEQLLAA